jgi:surface carbohydrate biosynthesis protein (TIGR04326 family)
MPQEALPCKLYKSCLNTLLDNGTGFCYRKNMAELLLVSGSARIPQEAESASLVAHFDAWDVPEGVISLPARLQDELTAIRAEHAAWAYDFGRRRVSGREVQDWLRCGEELSMWWCSLLYERHPKMTPGLYEIYLLRVLERLLDERGLRRVCLYGGDESLARSIAALCAASGRAFRRSDPDKTDKIDSAGKNGSGSPAARLYRACPAPLRAAARFVHWLVTVKRKLPFAPSPPPTDGPYCAIATYFPNIDMRAARHGRFRSRYFESLHDLLAGNNGGQAARLHWLFVRFPAPGISLDECIRLRDSFRQGGRDGASFHYLEEFISVRDMAAALWRFARLGAASLFLERRARKAFCFAGSRFNFWDRLSPYWAESFRGWRCLERCLQQRAFQRWTRLTGPWRWTLFPLENCPWERMLTHAVHATGAGRVFGVQHSVIRPADFRYFDDPRVFSASDCAAFQPDAIRSNGQNALEQWREAGVPAERLGKVEALRYLYLAEAKKPAFAGRPDRLLVLTSFFADETRAHLTMLAEAVKAGLLRGLKVTVKPHPCLPARQYLRDMLGERAAEIREAGGSVADHLLPGTLVWASNSTAAVLDAAITGLPVMVMPPAGDFDLCPLQGVPKLRRTKNLEDVASALARSEPLDLPPGYLELNPALPLWRELLFGESRGMA